MRPEPRRVLTGLVLLGLAGGLMALPTVMWIGDFLLQSRVAPAATPVPPLMADAIWARANGGRATELQPLNPFTLGRMMACHALAERHDEPRRAQEHELCMQLIPGLEGIGYLANLHLQGEGVWEDVRVPFAQLATMGRVTSSWTKAELVNTLAARAAFTQGFIGLENASRGYFGKASAELTLPQAALLAAFLGDRAHADPWCHPGGAADLRRRILERMRDNGAIDDAALDAANRAELGLAPAPPQHKPCAD